MTTTTQPTNHEWLTNHVKACCAMCRGSCGSTYRQCCDDMGTIDPIAIANNCEWLENLD